MESEHDPNQLRMALPRINLRQIDVRHMCVVAAVSDVGLFADIIGATLATESTNGEDAEEDEAQGFGSIIKYRRGATEYAITESVGLDRIGDVDVAAVRIAYD